MNNQYRLKQYNPGAWCIEELITHGEKSKTPGRTEWKAIKYPGNLRQASERLLSLVIGTGAEYTVQQLIDAVRAAEGEITTNLAAFVEAHKVVTAGSEDGE